MTPDQAALRRLVTADLTEMLVRVAVVAFLLFLCVRVFMPFAGLVGLAMILAIALYPAYERLVRALGGRRRLAGVVFVLAALLLVGIPMVLLGSALATQLGQLYDAFEHNTLAIPPPDPRVAGWPVIGERLSALWTEAAGNLPVFVEKHGAPLKAHVGTVLLWLADGAAATLVFFAAIVVAGAMMAYARTGGRALARIVVRLAGPERGPRLVRLIVATVRSVATGVVGVAMIQAILLGMGFLLAGIPGAGVLAVVVMLLAILQLPVVLVSLPAAAWMWWADDDMSTVLKVVFTVWFVLAGTVDNILKPLLLGRGVDAPMLVILIGAIGGMATAGIPGLFIGAVLLAVGYTVFSDWVDGGEATTAPHPAPVVPPAELPDRGPP
ncbi:AI-2E family transporter [Pseudoxanthomonas sp. 10H]|uniref:AI-2E family transporter n=1 Tax=Pseudoxanthomonas sp. 10H TaxID=3242729 RepID=UPI00355929CB